VVTKQGEVLRLGNSNYPDYRLLIDCHIKLYTKGMVGLSSRGRGCGHLSIDQQGTLRLVDNFSCVDILKVEVY
jgi:hypothetical protein